MVKVIRLAPGVSFLNDDEGKRKVKAKGVAAMSTEAKRAVMREHYRRKREATSQGKRA